MEDKKSSMIKAVCKDGNLNSRGFSNPWKTSRFIHKAVWKTGTWIPRDFQVLGHVAVPRLNRRIFDSSLYFHGFKNPRLFAFGFPSFRRFFCVLSCWTCFSISLRAFSCPSPRTDPETSSGWRWRGVCCFANGQWLTDNGCFFVVRNNTAKIRLYFVITK